jgi:hypothetical protein
VPQSGRRGRPCLTHCRWTTLTAATRWLSLKGLHPHQRRPFLYNFEQNWVGDQCMPFSNPPPPMWGLKFWWGRGCFLGLPPFLKGPKPYCWELRLSSDWDTNSQPRCDCCVVGQVMLHFQHLSNMGCAGASLFPRRCRYVPLWGSGSWAGNP